ncbi:arsenate reductase family protein [Limosilactobacillus ingluviei]|uniref:arsenate reductase family protein n=1 Tax=Limosilactobacillus ingluviei TaxID=148604 RepID=UPI000312C2AB|nr:arsenate reductase family protein [Limosilactobacillus ingluviei]
MPTFYCYQRCSTCKKAERWLVEHGVAFDKVDLVATPPAEADLLRWLTANQARGLRYFFNTSGQHYRQLGLKDQLDTMTLQQAAQLLASDGKLIKRPLMVEGEHVTAGFKPAVYEQEWLS